MREQERNAWAQTDEYRRVLGEQVANAEKDNEHLRDELRRRSEVAILACDIKGCTRPSIWAVVGEAGDLYFCAWHTTTYIQHAWQRAERAEALLEEVARIVRGDAIDSTSALDSLPRDTEKVLRERAEWEDYQDTRLAEAERVVEAARRIDVELALSMTGDLNKTLARRVRETFRDALDAYDRAKEGSR